MKTIVVAPTPEGWAVLPPAPLEALHFVGGAAAENTAREIAAAFADAGEPARVYIHARDGSIIGRFKCTPNLIVGRPPVFSPNQSFDLDAIRTGLDHLRPPFDEFVATSSDDTDHTPAGSTASNDNQRWPPPRPA